MKNDCRIDEANEIRFATGEDLERVLEIERVSFADPWSYDYFKAALKDLFLVSGKEVSGFLVACVCENLGRAVILKIAVHPDLRGRGIATRLLEKGIEEFRKMHIAEVELDVDIVRNGARRLYEKFGFKVVQMASIDFEEDETFYMMKLELKA